MCNLASTLLLSLRHQTQWKEFWILVFVQGSVGKQMSSAARRSARTFRMHLDTVLTFLLAQLALGHSGKRKVLQTPWQFLGSLAVQLRPPKPVQLLVLPND